MIYRKDVNKIPLMRKFKVNFKIKSLVYLLLFNVCITQTFGQNNERNYCRIVVDITKTKKSKKVKPTIDVSSKCSGDTSFLQSLKEKIIQNIEVDKKVKKGKYTVTVRCIINKDGDFSDVLPETHPGFGLTAQVVSIIKKNSRRPKWEAVPGGAPIKPYRTSKVSKE